MMANTRHTTDGLLATSQNRVIIQAKNQKWLLRKEARRPSFYEDLVRIIYLNGKSLHSLIGEKEFAALIALQNDDERKAKLNEYVLKYLFNDDIEKYKKYYPSIVEAWDQYKFHLFQEAMADSLQSGIKIRGFADFCLTQEGIQVNCLIYDFNLLMPLSNKTIRSMYDLPSISGVIASQISLVDHDFKLMNMEASNSLIMKLCFENPEKININDGVLQDAIEEEFSLIRSCLADENMTDHTRGLLNDVLSMVNSLMQYEPDQKSKDALIDLQISLPSILLNIATLSRLWIQHPESQSYLIAYTDLKNVLKEINNSQNLLDVSNLMNVMDGISDQVIYRHARHQLLLRIEGASDKDEKMQAEYVIEMTDKLEKEENSNVSMLTGKLIEALGRLEAADSKYKAEIINNYQQAVNFYQEMIVEYENKKPLLVKKANELAQRLNEYKEKTNKMDDLIILAKLLSTISIVIKETKRDTLEEFQKTFSHFSASNEVKQPNASSLPYTFARFFLQYFPSSTESAKLNEAVKAFEQEAMTLISKFAPASSGLI